MKVVFSAVLLAIIQSSIIKASPSQKDIETAAKSSAIKGPIQRTNITISNHYIPTDGVGIHKFHKSAKKSWNDARNTCLNEGGHLAVINSAMEEAVIVKYTNITASGEQFWIGIHELFKKDEWVSVKDERFDAIGYVHWAPGQPDAFPNEHCLTITHNGLNDFPCDEKLFFVCEM